MVDGVLEGEMETCASMGYLSVKYMQVISCGT